MRKRVWFSTKSSPSLRCSTYVMELASAMAGTAPSAGCDSSSGVSSSNQGFAASLLIRELAQRLPQKQRAILPVVLTTTIGVTLAAPTVTQQMQWASDILLYTRGLESAPANLTVRDNLASALLKANQPARAIPLYQIGRAHV